MPYLTILAVIEQGFQRQIVPSCARTYLEGTKTYLYFRKRDQYKRLIAVCYVGPHNINDQMVVDGWPTISNQLNSKLEQPLDKQGVVLCRRR